MECKSTQMWTGGVVFPSLVTNHLHRVISTAPDSSEEWRDLMPDDQVYIRRADGLFGHGCKRSGARHRTKGWCSLHP